MASSKFTQSVEACLADLRLVRAPAGLETWPETGFSRVVSYTWAIKK